jgi:hypothetical protein
MDGDENDLLYSNSFIPTPEVSNEISSQMNTEFRNYYERERSINEERKLRDSIDKMSIRSIRLDEDTDDGSLINSNPFIKISNKESNNTLLNRRTKEIITYVSVDSRDRNKILYPKPSNFKIFLGRSFYNVKNIKLSSVEFPNTNAVINNNNHNIYWVNQEDIDKNTINAITNTYPEYNVQLRIGSYISTSLQTELTNKLATVKRLDKTGDYHYFIASLDIDTDIVTFVSLILTQLSVNPIQSSINTNILEITSNNHGYYNGEYIYLQGVKTFAGIPSNVLNAKHQITKISDDKFRIEINIKASETSLGGGNTCKSGRIAPFKFLFGEKDKTIAPNIGYPLENSSDLIKTYIESIENFYQVLITTKAEHGLTSSNLGQVCTINGSDTIPSLNGNKTITQIISNVSFYVGVNTRLTQESYNTGQVTINTNVIDIQSIANVNSNTIKIKMHSNHNYTLSDIGKKISLFETTTTPNLDESYTIYNVYETDSIIIPGSLPSGGYSPPIGGPTEMGANGYVQRNNPLKSHTPLITGIIQGATITEFICPNHNLNVGDSISFLNLVSYPDLTKITSVILDVPNNNRFVIDIKLTSYDATNINAGLVKVSSGLITVSFPNHRFNKIVSIQNTTGYPTGQTYGNLLLVQTLLPHNLNDNDHVRLQKTDSIPSIDNGYNVDTVISVDKFTIPYSYPITSSGENGITSFNQDFYLYGCKIFSGVDPDIINNKLFTVRDVIDSNTFTFYNNLFRPLNEEYGGGDSIYISSLLHGFNGVQTNTKNSLLNRSINLQGENYAFLCCPQLSTMMNTGNVKNVFARITLDQSPGSMVFSYLSNPKTFDSVPLSQLNELDFSILNYDGSEYEFNDLDYSFTLQITEVVDITDNFQLSSKRGIVDA